MRKLKKPVSILLSAMLIISLFTIIPFNVSAAVEKIDYIDKDGKSASAEANIVTGSEAFFGEPGKTTWYVVNGDVNFGELDMVLAGDTNIILADDARLECIRDIKSFSEEEPESEDDKPKLYIFGQYGQDGRLEAGNIDSDVSVISYGGFLKANVIKSNYILWRGSAKTMEVKSAVLVVNSGAMEVDNSLTAISVGVAGGSLKANFIEISDPAGSLSILNGSLDVNYVFVCGDTNFMGGTTVVTDKAKVSNITIGCNSQNDSITVRQYEFLYDDYTMTVVPDETLFDGLNTYSGTVTREEAAAMAGKRVVLAHEHTDADMTLKAATNPTYDPATGKYTDGNTEYYTCNKCDGCFVKDGSDYVAVAPESVVVPYFRYTLDSDSDGTSCTLSEYNGQDADIVIPDAVPEGYFDSTLVGKPVTKIDRIAFNRNTTITSVTAGDELKIIGEKAFKKCTELKSVTVGNGLEWIQSGAFEDCTELESFTSSAHSFTYVYGQQVRDDSFDENAGIVFHGPHGSTLLEISQLETNWSFIPTDRHQDPTWTWAADYSSATAVFDCNGTCQLANGYELTDTDIEAAETDMGTQYTASVELDGETYTETKPVSYWKTLQADINAAADGTATTITLAHDCTALADDTALIIPAGKRITLILQGHTIDRNLESAVANGNVITNNGTLSLIGADGTIKGGKNIANGGAIVNNGTLDITGITITGNVTEKDGGAVYNSGTVNFESGTMSYNSAGKYGSGSGGALSAHSGTININSNNCYIDNNTAEVHGGAIYLGTKDGNTATLNLNGGWITENTAGNQGGGILHNGILNVQGGPFVKGNTAANGNNIYLRPDKLINVSGHLDSNDEYLGVKVENDVTGVFTTNLANQGSPAKFFTDSDDYFIANIEGEAALARYYVLSFDNNGGSGAQSSIKSKTSSIELPDCTFDAPEGKVFKAWKDPDGGTHKQPGETTEITSDYSKSMLAVWENLYNITVAESDHGTVTPSKYQAVEGETITLTIQPEDGYALESIRLVTDLGDMVPVSPTSFKMPYRDVNIEAVFTSAIPYVDAEGNDMPPVIAQPINSASTEWSGGWYYAAGEVTISERVTVKDDVYLILCDGAVLNIPKGVTLNNDNGSCLTIWQQKEGTGALNVTAPEYGNAGIGGIYSYSTDNYKSGGGLLVINGGIITACGGATGGAGIGVGKSSNSPLPMSIEINGGTVTATGKANYAAGIGVCSGAIIISGGAVNATGGDHAPGIGASGNISSYNVDNIQIFIEGGKVTATGGSCAAGIGGVANYGGGTITIIGGEVTAKGGNRMKSGNQNIYAGAGIGSGAIIDPNYNVNTVIDISGGKVNATGGCSYGSTIAAAAGIGVGEKRPNMNGQGDAEITLSWTDDVMDTMAVTSNGYNGEVTLESPFVDDNGAIYNTGAVADNGTIAGKTLRPYDGMGVTLAGHTLSLDGDIAVNFYMLLDDSVVASEGAYMQFTVPDTSPEYQSQKVMVSAADKVGDYYVFKCRVAAKDMDAQISAQLVNGEDAGKTYTYSVREYAEYLFDHLDVPQYAEAEQLVRAMLAYGKNAAYYFAGGDKEPETIDTIIPESAPTIAQSAEGVYDGASLSLKSQTTLSIYFKSSSPLELSIDDKTEGVDYEVVNDGINYAIRIRNIAVYDLDKPITVKVNGEDAVTYSPLNYCCKAQSSSDPKLVNTMKALYNYWLAADAYFD